MSNIKENVGKLLIDLGKISFGATLVGIILRGIVSPEKFEELNIKMSAETPVTFIVSILILGTVSIIFGLFLYRSARLHRGVSTA